SKHKINLISVGANPKVLSTWMGLCKSTGRCSVVVVMDYGAESEGLRVPHDDFKNR
ncbi:hypothetical protein EDC04DRAFT_2561754, partial [Pisolithus marmoratus]